jgi:putative hemolysin
MDEIEMLVRQASIEGVIEPVEEKLISGVFDYADLNLWDVMTPRTSIIAIDSESHPETALDLAKRHGFSRYPIYTENLDNIVGYLHVKDFIWAEDQTTLRSLSREILFIPGRTPLPEAFSMLTKAGKHMAIVLDEYGGTDGLLTLEDLLEVIFGEIEDEHSPLLKQPKIVHDNVDQGNVWILSGSTPAFMLEDILGIQINSDGNFTTLAGYLLAELGEIPEPGIEIIRHGYIFKVIKMDRLRIAEVEIKRSISAKSK